MIGCAVNPRINKQIGFRQVARRGTLLRMFHVLVLID